MARGLPRTIHILHVGHVDPKPSQIYLAPGASVASSYRLPGNFHESSRDDFPRVDDHIVRPGTREEMVRGVRMEAMSANPPHGEQQARLDAVIALHAAPGYVAAADVLTRFSKGSNFATDVCVRKVGTDPDTGARYLEELAFEIVSEQTRREMTIRAEEVIARGVRRLIAIFVKTGTIEEWNRETGRFEPLDLDGELADPVLTRPIALRGLLDIQQGGTEIAKVLDQKGDPYIVEVRRASRQEGLREGTLHTLTLLLEARFGDLPESARERLARAETAQLDAWFARAIHAGTLDDVFA